jgi:hypothetical protein
VSEEAVPGSNGGSGTQAGKEGAQDSGNGSSAQATEGEAGGPNGRSGARVSNGDTEKSAPGLAAQVIGNASLVTAALVYMGWAYENAELEYFHVSAFSLNLSTLEYVLKSTPILFRPYIILGAVIVVIAVVLFGPALGKLAEPPSTGAISRILQNNVVVSLLLGVIVGLVWFALGHNGLNAWFSHRLGIFYIALALVGLVSLLLSWPLRTGGGLFPYALAIVVAALCALWIAGLYANSLGMRAAENFAGTLSKQTAVTLYSVQTLALSGPGVTCQHLTSGSLYHYRYEGLRLLYVEPGTYYLLPVKWTQQEPTYVIDDSDQIRIELSGGNTDFGAVGTGCASG